MNSSENRPPARAKDEGAVLRKVKATTEKYTMFKRGDCVLVAVSGGADSVALLHILAALAEPLRIRLRVAHLNHSLRGSESDADADFVRALSERLDLPFITETADVGALARRNGLSTETAARQARRDFLLGAARDRGCDRIATGHHGDDQAETVLLRLVRGAGVRGLSAIRPVSADGFVRPLIECRRSELRSYLKECGISHREDSSNLDKSHMRNRVRHDLIPMLERDFNPSIVRLMRRTSRSMAEVDRLLSSLAEKAFQDVLIESGENMMSLELQALRTYDEATWTYVFQNAYRVLAGGVQSLSSAHLQALADLVGRRPTGTAIHLPGGIRARVLYGAVQFCRPEPHREPERVEREVLLPGVTAFPDLGGVLETEILDRVDLPSDLRATDPSVAFFDVKGISPPLSLGGRRRGDRIAPFGLRGTKKLKNLLIDLKIPRGERDRLPVLRDGEGLLWVAGVRRSDRARITPKTRKVVSIRWRGRG